MTVKIIHEERAGRMGQLAVGCSAAIMNSTNQKILLVRRADTGLWAVPGGYMEAGESVTECCVREVNEETGLQVNVKHLIGVYTNPHILLEYPDGNRLQIVVLYFLTEPLGDEMRVGDEVTGVGYFSRTEIEDMDISSFDRLRIADGFSFKGKAFIRDDFHIT
jgi:ADP-ribose pyrophosphatase YjhB (NUDIX family)